MFRLKVSHLKALTTFSLPKSPRSNHNTVDKNSIERSIKQCQHPGEGTHIHVVEQVRPQGMKNCNEIHHNNKNCRKTLPDNTVQQSRVRYRLKNTTILIK